MWAFLPIVGLHFPAASKLPALLQHVRSSLSSFFLYFSCFTLVVLVVYFSIFYCVTSCCSLLDSPTVITHQRAEDENCLKNIGWDKAVKKSNVSLLREPVLDNESHT